MLGLLDALGIARAVIAGHDWGAPVAWLAAQLRPDRFPAVIALSVPFIARGTVRPTTVMPQTDDAVWYQLYFQEPGVAEAEYDRNVRTMFRIGRLMISGDAPAGARPFMVPRQGGLFSRVPEPPGEGRGAGTGGVRSRWQRRRKNGSAVMRQTQLRPLLAAGALACGTILALAAPSSAADTHSPAKPAHRRSEPQRVVPGGADGGSLSRRLSRSGGVLHPPPFSGSSTPVIPPPGTPGGNPHIQPK